MLKKITVNLAGSLYQRENTPVFVLRDGAEVPNERLLNARFHHNKLVFGFAYTSLIVVSS
jgi:hypothetical protein